MAVRTGHGKSRNLGNAQWYATYQLINEHVPERLLMEARGLDTTNIVVSVADRFDGTINLANLSTAGSSGHNVFVCEIVYHLTRNYSILAEKRQTFGQTSVDTKKKILKLPFERLFTMLKIWSILPVKSPTGLLSTHIQGHHLLPSRQTRSRSSKIIQNTFASRYHPCERNKPKVKTQKAKSHWEYT